MSGHNMVLHFMSSVTKKCKSALLYTYCEYMNLEPMNLLFIFKQFVLQTLSDQCKQCTNNFYLKTKKYKM